MEQIGQLQRWIIHWLALMWGLLALLISGAYFFCEWKPKKCENFRRWLEKHYPALGFGRKKNRKR
jgi:hypothetical protein